MSKEKIKTKASKEAMRWADDGQDGPVKQGPTEQGNDFDVRMSEEPDGMLAAKKIVKVLKEKGVCLVQANAPMELVIAAHGEATSLWEDGEFKPPMRVHDDKSMLEAQLWDRALKDEEKVVWIKESDSKAVQLCGALKMLGKNMGDFCGGLGPLLDQELGLQFDRLGQAMLSCYTGDKRYSLHIDNPHAGADEQGLPDNGMRLSCTYYINPHWSPDEESCEAGLDVYLGDPCSTPSSVASSKKLPKLRIAPHADTLVLYLSERMAHQVIATTSKERWFALQLWGLNGTAMQQMTKRLLAMRQASSYSKPDSDDDDD
eukprot:CAMPEP_0197623084 /NCGR_PEP_ID=MMETSP1338-20131121/3160_1 /TAXON_ID=43686 ORGANISM="Pelagodinium beii, Strain RCC1491" /NCGR_SAMPLE_ID=MMETSP1338 /ASSEMBLY_ACC=CAM_ASM_000754 /LENGTH=315 /DNA_ID=CAMNT_0043192933 /DNA_START=100 /DNA_END=1047 /DNA_ORIENTATION=+